MLTKLQFCPEFENCSKQGRKLLTLCKQTKYKMFFRKNDWVQVKESEISC